MLNKYFYYLTMLAAAIKCLSCIWMITHKNVLILTMIKYVFR